MEDAILNTPVAQTPKTNWVLFLLVGIVILAVGIVVGLLIGKYIYNPKPTPTPLPAEASAKEGDLTANWKTYVDGRFYFSVKYPENWVTLSFSDKWEPGTPIFVYSPDSKTSSIEGKVIGVIEGQGNFFLVNTYNKPQVTVKSLDNLAIGKNSKKTELTINQISGLLIVNEERTNSIEKLFVFEKEDYTFVVQLFWRKDKPEDEKTLDQILSTFKFVEQNIAQ